MDVPGARLLAVLALMYQRTPTTVGRAGTAARVRLAVTVDVVRRVLFVVVMYAVLLDKRAATVSVQNCPPARRTVEPVASLAKPVNNAATAGVVMSSTISKTVELVGRFARPKAAATENVVLQVGHAATTLASTLAMMPKTVELAGNHASRATSVAKEPVWIQTPTNTVEPVGIVAVS